MRDFTVQYTLASDFNDPFECKPKGYFPGDEDRILDKALGSLKDGLDLRNFFRDFAGRDLNPSEIELLRQYPAEIANLVGDVAKDGLLRERLSQLIYVACFSERFDSILMWSHYAAQHTGIVIGYKRNAALFDTIMKVEYQTERADIPFWKVPHPHWDYKLATTKFTDWAYEHEWRCFLKRDSRPRRIGNRAKTWSDNAEKRFDIDVKMSPQWVKMEKEAPVPPVHAAWKNTNYHCDGHTVFCTCSPKRFPTKILRSINPEDIAAIYLGTRTGDTLYGDNSQGGVPRNGNGDCPSKDDDKAKERELLHRCREFVASHPSCKLLRMRMDVREFKLQPEIPSAQEMCGWM